jgi:YesN/AraC family two-component response regulator
MSEFLKNLRRNQSNSQKQYNNKSKGQPQSRKKSSDNKQQQVVDLSPFLKAFIDDLVPSIRDYLNHAAESQVRQAVAQEKNAQAMEKLMENLPEIVQQAVHVRSVPRRKKINARKQEVLDLINKLRDENMTYEEVAAYLTTNKIPTVSGRGRWHAQTIHRLYMYPPC